MTHSVPPCRSCSGEECDLSIGPRRRKHSPIGKEETDTRRQMETRVTQIMSPEAQRTPQKDTRARSYESRKGILATQQTCSNLWQAKMDRSAPRTGPGPVILLPPQCLGLGLFGSTKYCSNCQCQILASSPPRPDPQWPCCVIPFSSPWTQAEASHGFQKEYERYKSWKRRD